jgi:hypothetical protein
MIKRTITMDKIRISTITITRTITTTSKIINKILIIRMMRIILRLISFSITRVGSLGWVAGESLCPRLKLGSRVVAGGSLVGFTLGNL